MGFSGCVAESQRRFATIRSSEYLREGISAGTFLFGARSRVQAQGVICLRSGLFEGIGREQLGLPGSRERILDIVGGIICGLLLHAPHRVRQRKCEPVGFALSFRFPNPSRFIPAPVAPSAIYPRLDCFQALGIKRYTLGVPKFNCTVMRDPVPSPNSQSGVIQTRREVFT